jgi:hypothetical protein
VAREVQALKRLDMSVAAAVFSKGMVVNPRQLLSMLDIFVAAAVFSKGIVAREVQF